MIDAQEFSVWIGVLSDRFGRSLKPPTVRAFYALLSDELTTPEFVAGCAACLRDCQFWPSPKDVIDRAKPQPAGPLSAAEAFERVHRIAGGSVGRARIPWEEKARLIQAECGPAAVRAFFAIGGRRRWDDLLEADVQWVRKDFVEVYGHAEHHHARANDAARLLDIGAKRGGGLTQIGQHLPALPRGVA